MQKINNQEKKQFVGQIISKELENQLKEIKEPESESKPEYIQIIEFVKLMLSTNEKFNEIINKVKITIRPKQNTQIKEILSYLVSETNKQNPIDNIIRETLKILSDNKVELYEIPNLVNVIHESLKNLNTIKITSSDIGNVIKLILFILIETKTIKISNNDYELILKVIDSSIVLLNKSVEIKINKFKNCFCF